MKLLLDFLPLIFFFATYKVAGAHADAAAAFATHWLGGVVSGGVVGPKEAPVLLATLVVVAATLLQVAWMHLRKRHIHLMLWINLAVIVLFGGLTVYFHNETFIKWKPSIVYWLMALVLGLSQALFRHNLLESMLGEELELDARVWRRLNLAWIGYFTVSGIANLWAVYAFSTDDWANFHVFGSTALTVLFFGWQVFYLMRHLPPQADKSTP